MSNWKLFPPEKSVLEKMQPNLNYCEKVFSKISHLWKSRQVRGTKLFNPIQVGSTFFWVLFLFSLWFDYSCLSSCTIISRFNFFWSFRLCLVLIYVVFCVHHNHSVTRLGHFWRSCPNIWWLFWKQQFLIWLLFAILFYS